MQKIITGALFRPVVSSYQTIQQEIKVTLREVLHRNNGLITKQMFDETISPHLKKGEINRMKVRLFVENSNAHLEWRSNINSPEILAKRLKISLDKVPPDILELFENSRMIEKRTKYPLLVPDDKKSLISYNKKNPVFGISIFVRPIVSSYASDTGTNPNYSYTCPTNSMGIFFHTDLDNQGQLGNKLVVRSAYGANFLSLINGGNFLAERHKIVHITLKTILPEIENLFKSGNYKKMVQEIIDLLHPKIESLLADQY